MDNRIISTSWLFIKNLVDSVGTSLHYVEDSIQYRIFTTNGSMTYETYLIKDTGSVITEDNAQNDLDLADFETNYKATANSAETKNQVLSNSLRIVQMTQNQDLTSGSYISVYNYMGSGSLFGFLMEITDPSTFIRLTVDGVQIMNELKISDIPVVGPGSSGNGPELSIGLWRSSNLELNYKPPIGIKYMSSVVIELKATNAGKKFSNGFVNLTKVS